MNDPALSWDILLVPSGYERLRIMRGRTLLKEGTFPRGFSMRLSLGDRVYQCLSAMRAKSHGAGQPRMKFRICIWQGKPSLQFGTMFGKRNRTIWLHSLPSVPGQKKPRQHGVDGRFMPTLDWTKAQEALRA